MQVCLLAWIKEVKAKEKPEDELENMYPLAAPPSNPTHWHKSKWPREEEPNTVVQLRKQVQFAYRGQLSAPRAREGA